MASTTVRVALSGELDMATASQARLVLAAARCVGCREVELDLSGLAFCDAAGLHVFDDAQRECAEVGGLLLLIEATPQVRRVLQMSGLDRLLADWRT